ncbi:MAG: carboxypeptidase-like regulatory domain-containing protein, partial [Terriglobia bacterium]
MTLKNVATNVTETATTDNAGVYVILNVPPGSYTLQVGKQGFETKTQAQFPLNVNQTSTFDFTLAVGSALQTVTVQAVAATLQTSSAELGTAIVAHQVNDLPLNGRNFTQLLNLTPGVSTINTAQNHSNKQFTGNPIGDYSFPSVNGQTNRSNLFLVDGLNDQESFSSTYSVAPVVDDIEEFKVDSHNDQAQFGGVLGGVVNVVTKSGTNQFHGAGWEFFRNTALNSRDPFNSTVSQLQQNQFGANIGGPVILPHYNGRNRTFFFGSYEGARIHSGGNARDTLPTTQEIASGDFSDFSGQIYNPYSTNPSTQSRAPFMCGASGNALAPLANGTQPAGTPCNKIPSSLIDSHMQALAKVLWPAPNVTGNSTYNYQQNLLTVHNSDNYSVRGDEQLGTKDSFWFRFSHVGTPQTSESVVGNNGVVTYNAHVWGASWNHTFGPSAILTLQMGRNFANGVSGNLFAPSKSKQLIQVSGLSSFLTCGYVGTQSCYFPSPNLSSITSGGESANNTNVADVWEWRGDFSKTHGKHTFSMGADFNTNGMTQTIIGSHFDFGSAVTSNPAAKKGNQGGYSVAS